MDGKLFAELMQVIDPGLSKKAWKDNPTLETFVHRVCDKYDLTYPNEINDVSMAAIVRRTLNIQKEDGQIPLCRQCRRSMRIAFNKDKS